MAQAPPHSTHLSTDVARFLLTITSIVQWNPSQADPVLFKYTTALHAYVQYVRIVLHRPFIPSRIEVSHASLVACTEAAHHIARMVEVQRNRSGGHAPLLIVRLSPFNWPRPCVLTLHGLAHDVCGGDSANAQRLAMPQKRRVGR